MSFPFLPVLLPRGGACIQWQKIWVQPEKPASEAVGDLSGGLCAGSMDLHPVPNVKRTFNEDGGRFVVINNYGDPKVDWEKKVPCMTRYTAEQIGEYMKNSGFEDVEVFKKDTLFCVVGMKK